MPHKPLILNPNNLRPLPEAMWDVSCDKCDRRQARWEFFPSDSPDARKGFMICSLCWLYESEWGKKRREDIDQMIRDVELSTEQIFQRAKGGLLWSCKDADRILGSIALTSRMFLYRGALTRRTKTSEVQDDDT
jgi:hypothetical protein